MTAAANKNARGSSVAQLTEGHLNGPPRELFESFLFRYGEVEASQSWRGNPPMQLFRHLLKNGSEGEDD